jgi:hypothetical protein
MWRAIEISVENPSYCLIEVATKTGLTVFAVMIMTTPVPWLQSFNLLVIILMLYMYSMFSFIVRFNVVYHVKRS